MEDESKYIANADNWTQSKSTAGNPNSNPEEFAEFANEGNLPSKNEAQEDGDAQEYVELPSVAKGKDKSKVEQDDEKLARARRKSA